MPEYPRLRDSGQRRTRELYPLNVIPDEIVRDVGGYLVYLVYIGRKDISGDDWGDAFANAIDGNHLARPVGIADVEKGEQCWSVKTVKNNNPFRASTVRLISGRCSPDYSYGITDPHEDIQRTGEAVLGIWNERVNIAQDHYRQSRVSVLVRSPDLTSYVLFEEELDRVRTNDYHWEEKPNGNLLGFDRHDRHVFTWQPHGSQFTINTEVPPHAVRFTIRLPDRRLNKEDVLDALEFDPSWVTIL